MPTRREAGGSELPAKAQERRLQRRAGLGGWGPAALHPPPLAPAGCCGACRIGPPKPEAGGNRRKVARVRGGAGTIPSPRTRRGSRGSPRRLTSGALPSAPRSGSQATAPSASGAAGKLLLLGCWRQTRGDHGRPQVHGGRCNAEGAWGFRPRSREAGKQPSPYLSGWGDTGRAPFPGVPDRKITTKGGPGKSSGWLQDKVGGSSSTAKKTLPSRPGLFGKLPGRKCGAARVPSFSAGLAGSRSKHICLAHRGLL